MSSVDQIRWREPFRARARLAHDQIKRGWFSIAARGASIPLVGTTLLIFWRRGTGEPIRPMLPLLLLFIGGLIISALLTLELFIPHRIRLGQSSIFLGKPRTVEWFRYSELARCEVSSSPLPQLRAFGHDSEMLFAICLDPSLDIEILHGLLSERGVHLQRGAA